MHTLVPHPSHRPSHRLLAAALLIVLSMLLLTGCGSTVDGADAAVDDRPRRGGTAWMETAQEPPVLNWYLGSGGMSITDVLTTPLKSTWVVLDDRGAWKPLLATTVPTLANGGVRELPDGGMDISFAIDERATWSDGVAITCADLQFTWKTVMDPRWKIGSRIGWQLVEQVECATPHAVRIVLREHHAPYLVNLLNTAPLPKHALAKADFNTVWNNRITVSSGPFIFAGWERGDRITLERNPRWWRAGPEGKPYIDRLVTRFAPDASTMKLDLRMEDADMIGLSPDTNLPAELDAIPTASFDVRPGAGWENLTFNTGRFPFNDVRVRRAAAYAIDRDALVDVVLRGQVPRLDSTLLPYQVPYYHPTFTSYRRDITQVDRRMAEAGWTRDAQSRWRFGDGRLAKVLLTTTTGNPLRLKTVQLIAAQLTEAGFVTEILMVKPEVFFGAVVSRGEFDLALYAFTQGVDPSQAKLFSCSEIARAPDWTGKNNFKYCRRDVDRMLAAADRELDVERRATLTRDLAEVLATDMPALPLYQQPDTLAWNHRLRGVKPNAMGRHYWNIDEWWLAE
ncbi:MAG: extracellular solute-binding protein family 5 [Thermoleophilia bacterium]|nr:extracellular solute-binding protein family 5 [Thermoleophilia bacterium]MCZ4495546.1 extracellular solute-binding protein family 5 [Thermoleophilia bacterium]